VSKHAHPRMVRMAERIRPCGPRILAGLYGALRRTGCATLTASLGVSAQPAFYQLRLRRCNET
jgi:hypothetical protein